MTPVRDMHGPEFMHYLTGISNGMTKNFFFAVATLMGTIVGLGMFGIPYTASKAGFFVGVIYLIILGGIMVFVHLTIGEIVERTKEKHRLTGYIEKYLGARWKQIIGAIIIFAIYAALLAYIIVAGKFLELIFGDLSNSFTLSLVFWAIISPFILRGVKTIGAVELGMSALLLLLTGVLFTLGIKDVNAENFSGFNLASFFLPYGVIIFAMDGGVAVPEMRELLKLDGKTYKRAIIIGTLIPVFIYFIFMSLVVGVSGVGTSEEALAGLSSHLGPGVIKIGAIFGLLAIITSYLTLGSNLKHTFEYDWRINKVVAGTLVTAAPIALFVLGFQKFIEVISFSGAVFGAIIFIFTLLVYLRAKKQGDHAPGYALNVPKLAIWALIALFALGGVYEIIYLLL